MMVDVRSNCEASLTLTRRFVVHCTHTVRYLEVVTVDSPTAAITSCHSGTSPYCQWRCTTCATWAPAVARPHEQPALHRIAFPRS